MTVVDRCLVLVSVLRLGPHHIHVDSWLCSLLCHCHLNLIWRHSTRYPTTHDLVTCSSSNLWVGSHRVGVRASQIMNRLLAHVHSLERLQ